MLEHLKALYRRSDEDTSMIAFFPSPVKKKPKSPKRTQILRVLRHPQKKVMKTSDTFETKKTADPFSRINNEIFKDKRLSLKSLGLLCLCLSLDPETWTFSIRGLDAICKDGRTAIIRALDELEELGYLRRSRVQEHNADGGFGHTHYVFYDTPQEEGAPCTRFVYTDDPYTENQPQEKNQLETNQLDSPHKSPRGRAAAKKAPDHLPEEFDRLWKAYPRGEDKQGAIAEWDKLKPDEATVYAMKLALLAHKQSEEWQRGIGIPYFVRWLRHRRWEDEKLRSAEPKAAAPSYEPEVSAWQ